MTDRIAVFKKDKNKIVRDVKKITGEKDESSETFMVGMVMYSSAFLGPNVSVLSAQLGYTKGFVSKIGKRLRKNDIWTKRKIRCNWWDKKDGGIEFNLDLLCAMDMLKKVPA